MTQLPKQIVATSALQRFIVAVMLLAGVLAGLETSNSLMAAYGPLLRRLDLLVERFYPEFKAAYEERYQERYGFWRPMIERTVRKFLECGDLKHGFARVRRPKCREEFFVPFSCRVRCFCHREPVGSLGIKRNSQWRLAPVADLKRSAP